MRAVSTATRATRLRLNLETTSIYAQVSIRELKRLHSALHPAASLGKIAGDSVPGEQMFSAVDLFNQLEEESEKEDTEEG